MTREDQIAALDKWCGAHFPATEWWAEAIVDNFPEFMEKCAEVGLVRKVEQGPVFANNWYGVPKPKPPHEHNLRVTAAGSVEVVIVCDGCDLRHHVPNRLPLEIPE